MERFYNLSNNWRTNRRTKKPFVSQVQSLDWKSVGITPPEGEHARPYGPCARCGLPAFLFLSNEWEQDVPKEWADKVLCLDCYNKFRKAKGKEDFTYAMSQALTDQAASDMDKWHEFYDSHPELNFMEKEDLWRRMKLGFPVDEKRTDEETRRIFGTKRSDPSPLQELISARLEAKDILDATGLKGKAREQVRRLLERKVRHYVGDELYEHELRLGFKQILVEILPN